MRALRHLLLFLSVAVTAAISADPTLTFEEKAVVARVKPGASTAWFGVVSEWGAYSARTSEYARILEDEDRDGIVRFELDGPKPVAVWMVVDMSNGKRAISAPAGVIVDRKPLPPSALKGRRNNPFAKVVIEDEALVVCWVVRPGAGAWRMVADDELHEEGEERPGSVSAELRGLRAVGKSPDPPEDFAPGDIVVTVALDRLAVSELRVNQEHP